MSLVDIFRRPSLLAGSLIVLLFFGVAIFAPLIAPPADPSAPQYILRDGNGPTPEPPSPEHILGLLPQKYDVFYGLVWGTRIALMMGLTVAFGRALVGVVVGLLSGYSGGLVDAVLMRIADAFMAFPMIAAIVVMLALFGFVRQRWPSGWFLMLSTRQEQIIMLTFVLFGWVPYARLMRGNVLVEREKIYMQAARSIGVPPLRLISRHLFPNATYGLLALISSDIGAVVVLISAFTFIGILGAEPGGLLAEWGRMLSTARDWIIGPPSKAFEHWYTYMPVSAAIVLFSTGWSLVGDGLRDALDPRLRAGRAKARRGEEAFERPALAPASAPAAKLADTAPVRVRRGAGTPLDDPEAFAWLEYLAVRQGATQALLLSPEERRERPPEWVLTGGAYTPPPAAPTAPPGDGDTALAEARRLLAQGDLSAALEHYTELIRSRNCLAETVQDLSQVQAGQQTAALLQALGDAHLRLGHPRQALEAYARAERRMGEG